VLLTIKFLNMAKFTTLTLLLLLFSCGLSFPIVGLKISAYFYIEIIHENFHIVLRKLIKYMS
jgi:hypothetical protein